jgi:flagellar biosynthesis/type III secretory pathway protein FliH
MLGLAEQYLRRRFQEGKEKGLEEGKQEGRRELSEKVRAWNERRLESEQRGEEFNEPPPIDD